MKKNKDKHLIVNENALFEYWSTAIISLKLKNDLSGSVFLVLRKYETTDLTALQLCSALLILDYTRCLKKRPT